MNSEDIWAKKYSEDVTGLYSFECCKFHSKIWKFENFSPNTEREQDRRDLCNDWRIFSEMSNVNRMNFQSAGNTGIQKSYVSSFRLKRSLRSKVEKLWRYQIQWQSTKSKLRDLNVKRYSTSNPKLNGAAKQKRTWTRPNEFGSMTARKGDKGHNATNNKAIQGHTRPYKAIKGHKRP